MCIHSSIWLLMIKFNTWLNVFWQSNEARLTKYPWAICQCMHTHRTLLHLFRSHGPVHLQFRCNFLRYSISWDWRTPSWNDKEEEGKIVLMKWVYTNNFNTFLTVDIRRPFRWQGYLPVFLPKHWRIKKVSAFYRERRLIQCWFG